MQDFILPILSTLATALITWFFARRKNNAEAKSAEIENEIKSASFYRDLLDDAMRRLKEAIETIESQDLKIKSLMAVIEAQDVKIKSFMAEIEHLTDELKKFKQLNGKTT